jgi:hypothetical protein
MSARGRGRVKTQAIFARVHELYSGAKARLRKVLPATAAGDSAPIIKRVFGE